MKHLCDSKWFGEHFINIMMKKNGSLELAPNVSKNAKQKIKRFDEYAFNDEPSDKKIQHGGGSKKISNHILMDKINLEKLSKSDLIDLILKLQKSQTDTKDDAKPSTKKIKPVTKPQKSVKSMVKKYEEDIISTKPIPKPKTEKPLQESIQEPKTKKRTIISQIDKALKGYTKSFDVELRNKQDPLIQLQKTRKAIEYLFNHLSGKNKGFKFIETLKVEFIKHSNDKLIKQNGYFNSITYLITNKNDIKSALQIAQQKILDIIAKWISKGSGWTIKLIKNHYINVVNYNPMKGSSYMELPEGLRNSKGIVNIKNKDNECFRWCHIRHLNPQDKDPQRIKKIDKQYIEKLDYSNIEFPVTIKQINKIEKQNNICINLFGYEEKQKYPIYISKENYQDHMELLLITNGKNTHYILIKDFNKFMFRQNKHEHKNFLYVLLTMLQSRRCID